MKILERLAIDAYEDTYFKELFDKANDLLFKNIFKESDAIPLNQKELIHLLRFCDILSNSKKLNTEIYLIKSLPFSILLSGKFLL